MSNYTKSTNFATKDNLTPGDPLKVVRGTEIDTEFNNIATAIATKTDNSAAAITGGTITGITDLAIADGGTGASTATAAINNLLPVQTSAANKYLQSDGTNVSWDAVTLSTADITGTLPVANGGTGVTSSTGTGNVVLSNSPTLVTPALGTPASGVATNITGLPISTGVSGLGTGVATFLGTPSSANLISAVTDETGTGSLVFATSPTLVTPALGTPSALVGTNITGTASGLTAGNVTTNANLTGAVTSVGNATSLGSFSSANLLGALTDETGTGSAVFATSPALVTPDLGTPSAATLTNATGLPIATGVSGLGSGVATFLATPSSANLRSALTDETGTGSAVFATSPTLVTPILGTPTSVTLTNATGLPISTGVSGLGTGVATALAVNTGSAGAPVLFNGALGTPTSGTVTNLTGTASININGTVGATTATTGAFTTLTATGDITAGFGSGGVSGALKGVTGSLERATSSATTLLTLNNTHATNNNVSLTFTNPDGNFIIGKDRSTGGAGIGGVYEAYIYTETNRAIVLGVNNAEKMRLNSTGLGIGTSSPDANLTVNGAASFAAGTALLPSIARAGDLNTGLWFPAADTIAASTNGSERYRVDSSGNFGIGTSSPAVKFQVNGSGQILRVTDGTTGASIYSGGGLFGFNNQTGEDGMFGSTASHYLYFATNGAEKMRLDSAGGLKTKNTIGVGDATPSTSGAGITFPATQSASSDANTLDDYEEGTFTPTVRGETTSGTTTYSVQTGVYTKVGRQVTLALVLNYSALTGTGNMLIGGLPFSNGSNESVGSIMSSGLNWSGGTQITPYFPTSSSSLYLYGIGDDIGQVVQQCFDEAASMRITITYFV